MACDSQRFSEALSGFSPSRENRCSLRVEQGDHPVDLISATVTLILIMDPIGNVPTFH